MESDTLELIKQALNAAESSIGVAKRLLGDINRRPDMRGGTYHNNQQPSRPYQRDEKRSSGQGYSPERSTSVRSAMPPMPSDTGIFDGQDLVFQNGNRVAVPASQVTKSLMVAGDQLKKVEENGEVLFKQIQRVKRKRLTGVLAKKDGRYSVLTEEGSYRVYDDSVDKNGIKLEDQVAILTSGIQKSPWAVIEQGLPKLIEENDSEESTDSDQIEKKTEQPERKKADKKIKEKKELTISETPDMPAVADQSSHMPVVEVVDMEELR